MIVFLDLETTGLTEQFCSILEVAAICTEDNGDIIDTFHEYINPGKPIPANIVQLTRITDAQVANCRTEREVLDSFITWCMGIGADSYVAHNASFDFRFLRGRSDILHLSHPFNRVNVIDTMATVSALLKAGKLVTERTPSGRSSKRQESVAKALNISYGEGGAHSAAEDTLVLKKMYFKLLELQG